ncbi:site-2 protease family protein [Rhodococcus sp. D2-41]|uniref:Site-2 protease family protein n=1 Tax=Speluncibacter jeojiensis TaxID=2710754 RepID=A0A9X4M757_9ACTN|nr:site-2 protease family protein [Rhodococcus sp. D2-41]MDG3010085.1 site-2 protease family protein [Rhodococcus sp. D2-41]MDG3015631.1 site-2 protease family protein [Corynebacteriales bacterium D3-21]
MAIPISRARGPRVLPSPVFLALVVLTVVGGVVAWTSDQNLTTGRIGVFILVVGGWVVSLCLHEFAHAYTAYRAGDREVEARGYLTLNPLKYSHPVLSVVLPLIFIALGGIGLPGGAVYLDTNRFPPKIRRRIALAGPLTNLVCAIVLLAAVRTLGVDSSHRYFWYGLSFLAFLQVMATVLNLLPIPGLDGYALLEPHLSANTRRSLAQVAPFGMLAVFALLTLPVLNTAFFNLIYWLFELSGVPRVFSAFGYLLMRFWVHI